MSESHHHPSDMVPRADAKMQIPSCQMRFGAGWPGYFYERWVRSWTLKEPDKKEPGTGGFSGASGRVMTAARLGWVVEILGSKVFRGC